MKARKPYYFGLLGWGMLLVSALACAGANTQPTSEVPTATREVSNQVEQPSPTAVLALTEDSTPPAEFPTVASVLPSDTHPRLWLTPDSVARYRSWAVAENPLWEQGLALLAERARYEMDEEKRVPDQDCGDTAYEAYPTEKYAMLFAFLANVGPDEAQRQADGERARTLLMHVMNTAAQGPANDRDFVCNESEQYPAFRHPDFFTSDRDRARYHGEAYALTVDWIYPLLSASDKATIHKVFLQWAEDIITRGYHHPEPVGVLNDPLLLQDSQQVRFAGNNYFAAHMRNLGLLALALDPADDPDLALRAYLAPASGSYLYIFNHLITHEARGGLLPEGLEYSPQTASYVAQFLWALQSSGQAEFASAYQADFWRDFVNIYFHTLSPNRVAQDVYGETVWVYQPAWYGDAQHYQLADFTSAFGALLQLTPDPAEQNALRWAMLHTPAGGEETFLERVRNPVDFRESMLYFMAFDPNLPAPTDPRPQLPTEQTVAGMNWLFSRTAWSETASWLNFRASWNSIDHQMADGLHFEWYANGEWLTKGRNGYADIAEGIASSEFYNTLALENAQPQGYDESDWRMDLWKRGSQWNLVNDGDPSPLRTSFSELYTFAESDATPLYNTTRESAVQVTHTSRSLFWLKPKVLAIFDRASTQTDGLFKRWWLQLANPATVNGTRAQSTTPNGQVLTVDVVFPTSASLQAINSTDEQVENTAAPDSQMQARLMSAAEGNPQSVQFLHVLQVGSAPQAVLPIASADNAWLGVWMEGVAVLFSQVFDNPATPFSLSLPVDTRTVWVSGLQANGSYDILWDGSTFSLQNGSQFTADAGGVLGFIP
jgi:hypothetical protein